MKQWKKSLKRHISVGRDTGPTMKRKAMEEAGRMEKGLKVPTDEPMPGAEVRTEFTRGEMRERKEHLMTRGERHRKRKERERKRDKRRKVRAVERDKAEAVGDLMLDGKWEPNPDAKPEGIHGNAKYNPAFHPDAAAAYLRKGATAIEMAAYFGVSRETIKRWYDRYPEFRTAIDLGLESAEAWWYEAGRRNLMNPYFNSSLFMAYMTNRFGWSRKYDHTGTVTAIGGGDAGGIGPSRQVSDTVDVGDLTTDELRDLQRILRTRRGDPKQIAETGGSGEGTGVSKLAPFYGDAVERGRAG